MEEQLTVAATAGALLKEMPDSAADNVATTATQAKDLRTLAILMLTKLSTEKMFFNSNLSTVQVH